MKKEQLIEMKKGPQESNPAKNEVIEAANDSVLNVYLREIADYPQLSFEEEKQLAMYLKASEEER